MLFRYAIGVISSVILFIGGLGLYYYVEAERFKEDRLRKVNDTKEMEKQIKVSVIEKEKKKEELQKKQKEKEKVEEEVKKAQKLKAEEEKKIREFKKEMKAKESEAKELDAAIKKGLKGIQTYYRTKARDISRWSDYQGEMSWNKAKSKCNSIGMRLPLRIELEEAYKKKLTKDWEKDGSSYWTSEEYSDGSAYNFTIYDGFVFNDYKGSVSHVRCIR